MADENMLVGHIERFVDSVGGKDGKDGFSPTATVSKTDGVTTVTVTDQNGTTFAHILDGAKGDRGEDGKPGERGADGANGSDGFSPTAVVSKENGVTTIAVTDRNGTTTAQIMDGAEGEHGRDGADGKDGSNGFSPTATVMKADGITTITITDQNGTTSAEIQDGAKGERGAKGDRGDPGERGEKGEDGFSPTVALSKAGNATTVTVIDKNGTTTAQILNGAKGEKGDPGEQGERGPAGEKGAQGQRGEKGTDGFSPTISLNKSQGVTTISVTDKDGTTSAQIMDGAKGEPGKDADPSDYYTKAQTNDKIVEVITEMNLSPNNFTDAEKAKLAGLENYDDTAIKAEIAASLNTLGCQRKNLLKNTAVSKTANGVTFRLNDDGSVTLNGTAIADILNYYVNSDFSLYDDMVLSGCPEGGSTTGYKLDATETGVGVVAHDTGHGVVIKKSDVASGKISVRIRVGKGTVFDNTTFFPMLRHVGIADGTYEPYVDDLQTQIQKLMARITALESQGNAEIEI